MARGTTKRPPKPRTPATTDPTARVIQAGARWWQHELADVPNVRIHLGTAMQELYLMACAHLASRLADPETPPDIRDRIALRCAPLVAVQIRSNTGAGAPALPGVSPADEDALLEAYDVTPDLPAN